MEWSIVSREIVRNELSGTATGRVEVNCIVRWRQWYFFRDVEDQFRSRFNFTSFCLPPTVTCTPHKWPRNTPCHLTTLYSVIMFYCFIPGKQWTQITIVSESFCTTQRNRESIQTSRTALMNPSFSGLLVTWAYLPTQKRWHKKHRVRSNITVGINWEGTKECFSPHNLKRASGGITSGQFLRFCIAVGEV